MLKNKKCLILTIILIAIIIAGTVMYITKGINYSVNYDNSVSLQMYIDSTVEMEDIKNISKEIFKNKEVMIANTNESSKEILINVKEASQEEKDLLVQKINEKYQTTITSDDIEVIDNYKVNFADIIKPYILPTVISLAVIFIYIEIIYKKNEVIKILIYTVIVPIVAQLVYFSVLILARIPVGMFTMPIAMLVFIICILGLVYVFDNKYSNKSKKM